MGWHGFAVWATLVFILILGYSLARLGMTLYFALHKDRFNIEKNYLSYVALGVLLAGFLAINPSTVQIALNLIISIINWITGHSLEPIRYNVGMAGGVVYGMLVLGVMSIVFTSYRDRVNLLKLSRQGPDERIVDERIVTYVDTVASPSPHLRDRVREIMETRHARFALQLRQPADTQDLLYGVFSDDFHTFLVVIYCDDRKGVTVTRTEQNRLHTHVGDILVSMSPDGVKVIVQAYYVLAEGDFAPNDECNDARFLTEDEFLRSMIDFNRYLAELIHAYENRNTTSSTAELRTRSIAETFVAPSFCVDDEDSPARRDLKGYIDEWLHDDVDNRQLVLLGDYGMGKTTFLKYYAASVAKEILDGGQFARFPVLISLTNTSPRHGGIVRSVKAFVSEHLGVEYSLFEKLVHRGKIVFLLDAFDEMGYIGTHEQRFTQFNEIWQLATRNNKIILSGRPSYFPTEFELNQSLNIPKPGHQLAQARPYGEKIILRELDDSQVAMYIERYYPAEAGDYIKWINLNRSIRDLCKRPSMMHIIREMLPTLREKAETKEMTSSDIMDMYIQYWIDRQEEKGITSVFKKHDPEKRAFVLGFFRTLAAHFYLQGTMKSASSVILAQLSMCLQESKIGPLTRREEREGFENEILTGYFIEIEDDEYKFVHKSFYEYFVAMQIVALVREGDFYNELVLSDWTRDIVDFVYDAIPAKLKVDSETPALLGLVRQTAGRLPPAAMVPFWAHAGLVKLANRGFFRSFLMVPIMAYITAIDQVIDWVRPQNDLRTRLVCKAYELAFATRQLDQSSHIAPLLLLLRRRMTGLLTTIEDVTLRGLLWGRFENLVLNRVTFADCQLSDTGRPVFENVELRNVSFSSCQLPGRLTFRNCRFVKVDFSGLSVVEWMKVMLSLLKSGHTLLRFDNMDLSAFDTDSIHSLLTFLKSRRYSVREAVSGSSALLDELTRMANEEELSAREDGATSSGPFEGQPLS
jgi:hypothetical protein